MDTIVQTLNTAGRAFVQFALPMLLQSSLLILLLLALDTLLRRRVRAVFRYWIWMLVLVKLVLPPSLWSPVSIGTWVGDELQVPTAALLEPEPAPPAQAPPAAQPSPAAYILSAPDPMFVTPPGPLPQDEGRSSAWRADDEPERAGPQPSAVREPVPAAEPPRAALTWQGLVLLLWGMTVVALLLLLLQRAYFVQGLVAQAEPAGHGMLDVLEECRARLGLRRPVALRLSPNATSPAVCGLRRPTILIPQSLAPRLQGRDLRAVFLHELAHIRRRDLWINLAQTLLQIAYFYHPLLWLANAVMRRAREQAVDETVLVALGETAAQYPETLVNVAKLAFRRRPVLSLRLVGVVESKSALSARIRHMLSRPLPRTAKLGLLGLLAIFVIAAMLLPMAGMLEPHSTVVNDGPLDIRLVGVSPDGADELYDANGRKLDVTLAPLGLWDGLWKADEQRRDFVFEVPRLDGQLLFLPFPRLCPAGTNRLLGGSHMTVFDPGTGPSTMVFSDRFPSTYQERWGRLFPREVPIRKVDLTLRYFCGPRGPALCTFAGPFALDKTLPADDARPYQLTPMKAETWRGCYIKFRFTTSQPFDEDTAVLIYDLQGQRHFVYEHAGRSGAGATDLTYESDAVPWEQVSLISVGEKPHEIAFRNIAVHYPGRPQRTYPAYLDDMAKRLNLTHPTPEELGRYRFKKADEIIAVLDIARGRSQIGKIVDACRWNTPPVDFTALGTDARDKIRRTAASWTQSPSVWVRAQGVELGLMAGFAEFIAPAFALLDYRHPADSRLTHDVQYQALSGLGRYPNGLPAADMDRLKQFALRCTDGYTWGSLFRKCLRDPRDAGLADVLWELAQDERPWIWWPAVAQLLLRNDERLKAYADLPEQMKLRVILVDFRQLPGEEALLPQAKALLPSLLTAETVRMYPDMASSVRREITADLDHKEATALYMSLLRELSQPGTVWRFMEDHGKQHCLYDFVPTLVRDINLWYGVNIGQLGLFEPGKVNERLPDPDTLARVTAEALDWYQTHAGQQPRELAFEGRVVDTGGKPIAGATVTLGTNIVVPSGVGQGTVHEGGAATAQTDAEGRFVFRDMPPSKSHRFGLAVAAGGFVDRVNIQVDQLQDGRFSLGADPQDNVVVLEKPARLSGRAIGRDGRPLARTELGLYLYPTHGTQGRQLIQTDAEGRFVCGPLMSGSHLLRYGETVRQDEEGGYPGFTAARLVRVEEGQTVDDVVLDLRESTACLEMEIVDRDGQPVGAQTVFLEAGGASRKPPHPWVVSFEGVKPQAIHRIPNLPPLEGYLTVIAAAQSRRIPVKLVANETTHCKVESMGSGDQAEYLAAEMARRYGKYKTPDRPAPVEATEELASGASHKDSVSDSQEAREDPARPTKKDSDGPLDIRLVAVCPDGGDEFYDPNGQKLDLTIGPLGTSAGPWNKEEQHRDFVLQMPQGDKQLLFPTAWVRAAGTDRLLGGGSASFSPAGGTSTLIVSAGLDCTYREVLSRSSAREVPVRGVDLALQYFYGARRAALCTFTGPFRIGQVVQADEGRSYQLAPQAVEAPSESWLRFRFTTNRPFVHSMPVLLYDRQGRRYLVSGGGGSSSPQGADLTYDAKAIPWDQVAAVTVGEQPYTTTFGDIIVQYPGRPPRRYPVYLDRMAERLGLTGWSVEKLAGYNFKSPDEALAVLDIIRSPFLMRQAVQAISLIRPRSDLAALDKATRDMIRRVATSWLTSPDPQVRGYGLELGLLAGFPDFAEPAFALLENQNPTDALATRYSRDSALNGLVWYAGRMTRGDFERVKRLALRCDEGHLWSRLFGIYSAAGRRAGVADGLWELAQDDRPWLWWPALGALRSLHPERLKPYAELPEPLRVRLALIDPRQSPADDTLRPQVRALLPSLFTMDTIRMCPEIWHGLRTGLTTYLERREATAVYMDFLRASSQPAVRWQFELDHGSPGILCDVVSALLRDINLWYGVNLAQLGVAEPGQFTESIRSPRALTQALAEALDWYRADQGQQPRESVFAGRVVDTAGQGLAGVTLTLKRSAPAGDEPERGNPPDIEVGTLQTDAEGRFEFRGLSNTTLHRLHVTAPGLESKSVSVNQMADGRFYLDESPRDNVIVMEKPGRLAGRVTGRDGRPLANAVLSVSAYPAHDVPNHGSCPMDDQGRFTIDPATSGYHVVRYDQRNQQGTTGDYDGVTAYRLVEAREGQAVEDIVLDLRASTACLEFEIVDGRGRPLGAESAALDIDLPSGKAPNTWVMFLRNVKPQSVHRLPNLPPLEGYLDVTVMGWPPQRLPVKLVADETTRCKVQFAPSAGQPRYLATDRAEASGKPGVPDNQAPVEATGGLASVDSDGDGLSDFQEIHKYLTDPTKKDSDDDGTPDGDWNERREYAYSVRTVMRYLPPFDEKGLNDDFQDARVLKQTDEYIEIEVIHYPLATGYETVAENPNWRREYARDARLAEYLAPGVTTNWDERMRKDLLAALSADGIDVETLTDKQVVERVSSWLLKRSRSLDNVFTTYYVDYPQGVPRVYPGLEDAFRHEFERDSRNYDWTIKQHLDHEVLGKGMFYNQTHGSCTSTAVYLTTVLRALGIPTRMVLATPVVDASDRAQVLMVKNAITHNRVRLTLLAGLGWSSHGWTNHTFNEVYVGGRWCRLDYNQLGCSAFGPSRFGLQTHLYTFNDLSDVNFAPTWGWRYAKGEHSDTFQHDNPYSAVEVSELFGPHGNIPNPPFMAQDIRSHPEPDIFLFYPSRVSVWDEFIDLVGRSTANKTGRPHQKEFYENLFDGIWLTRPQDILVLLFSLDTPERVPAGYEDLLPKPWPEIESALQRGETVELDGQARRMNIVLLAAPTRDALKPLVQNSRRLNALRKAGGPAPALAVSSTRSSSGGTAAGSVGQLDGGTTVELLGVCDYPSEGKPWWRPDGSTLAAAPYQTANNKRELQTGFRDYELVVRYGGAPDMDIEWDVPGSASTGVTGSPYDADGKPIRDLTVCTVRFPETQTAAEVRLGVAAGAWQTRATHASLEREGTYTLEGGKAVAFGIPYTKDGATFIPVTTDLFPRDVAFRVVVARRGQKEVHDGGLSGSGGNKLNSLTYRFHCPLSDVKEFLFQTRPWTWVAFQNVSLRPGAETEVRSGPARAASEETPPRRAPDTEKVLGIGPAWEALRDALAGRYGGSIGGFSTNESQCAEYLKEVLSWTRPGDTFVLLFAFDMPAAVPASYQDLLPLPWSEIESRVRRGEQVEARGTARGLNVVVLATPTLAQLHTLIRQTPLLAAFRTPASEQSKAPVGGPGMGGGTHAQPETSPGSDTAGVTPGSAARPGGGASAEKARYEQMQFGPPVERVLGRDAPYIDLERGITLSPPSNLGPGNKTQALLQWCRGNGIDVIADPATGSLGCLDAQVVELGPDAWTSLSVEGLRQAVERGPRLTSPPPVDGLPVVSLRGTRRPAATYGLRTRTGTLGLLQIVDAANPQDGGLAFVKIRYRLVRAALAENAAPGQRELSLGEHQYLDLDTGRYITVAPAEANDPKSLMSRGIDLYFTVEPVGAYLSPLPQVKSLQLELGFAPHHPHLQEISADSVREWLGAAVRQLDRAKEVTAYASDRTFSFRTAEGTAGVLRVTWPRSMDVPRCTLQYRLLPELDIPRAEFPWGAATEGRQCRLRAPKHTWRAGETVTLSLDVRNQGAKALEFVRNAEEQCKLEVDGAWYGWAELLFGGGPVWVLEPQTELDDAMSIRLTNAWALPAEGVPPTFAPGKAPRWGRRLTLAPGRHTVRVRFYAGENRFSPAAQNLSLVSNPVDIAVLSSEESPSENAPVRPTGETAGRATDGGMKKPFSVYGTVTDSSGRPIAGVTVTAHCGMNTLTPTGQTVTDKAGRYTLSFGPGILSRDIILQAATIHAAKVGFYEASLCRQGGLAMAGRMPSEKDQQGTAWYRGVVLPDQRYEVNFVMRPAARIVAELVDAQGKPLFVQALAATGWRTLVLTGDKLYPSTNVLASIETDPNGAFVVESVPLESFWFEYGRPTPAKTASIHFTTPGTWRIRLQYDESQARLTLASVQPPRPALGLLELRVAPTQGDLGPGVAAACRKALAEGQAPADRRYLWVPVRPTTNLRPDLVVQAHDDTTWLLVHNEESFIMTPAQGWRLANVGRGTDNNGRPMVTLQFDKQGAERMAQLTQAHSGRPLAILVHGVAVSAPTVLEGQTLRVAATPGNFTEQEIDDLMAALHQGEVEEPAGAEAAEPPAGTAPDPVGRHALSFDGVDDKLVVPPSASLTLKPPFFIEVWAKPDFSMLPERKLAETPDEEPWPEMSLIRQGDELRGADSPSRAPGGSDTEGWPVPRPSSVHGLNNVQSGGFMGFLLRQSGGLFAVRKDGRVMQRNIFRASGAPSSHPGWLYYYSSCVPDGLSEDYVPAAAPLVMGGRIVPNGFAFKGEIAEVRLWNKVLTAEEIQRYEAISLTGNEPNLVACWDFERQAGGQVVYDITPNHNDARLGDSAGKDDADPTWVDLSDVATDRDAKEARDTKVINGSSGPTEKTLKQLLDEARPGGVVMIPRGRYTTPVEVTKPVVLRGESQEGCVIEVTADQPAILVNTGGPGDVTVENLTVQWQLATDKRIERPTALLVKDTNARIRNCRFVPLGDARRSPTAIFIEGRSNSTVDNCRFRGFEYTVCYGPNTRGIVQDCIITDCGHQGVINYDGSALTVQRCVIAGSKFHAVRCTGGTLDVKDNLLIKNANRGIYLGNKTGRGTITNNVILGNGSGISGFGRAEYVIANNVIMDNQYAGIDMRDSCHLSIRNNVLVKNQRGLVLFKEGTTNSNVVGRNAFWANATDAENMDKPEGSVTADPQFADPNRGDFAVRGPVQEQGQGLTDPQVIRQLWAKYEQLQADSPSPSPAPAMATPSPRDLSGRVVDASGNPVAGAQVALCTADQGVTIAPPRLVATDFRGKTSTIVETDTQGRFSFPGISGEFVIFAAHETGFVRVEGEDPSSVSALRLQRWGQVDGTLYIGRKPGVDETVKVLVDLGGGAVPWPWVRYEQEMKTRDGGRFLFPYVAPVWVRLSHYAWMPDGRRPSERGSISQAGSTNERPIRVTAGETLRVAIGGTGRPVIGRLILPEGYDRRNGQTWATRMLATVGPDIPEPAGYERMSPEQRQQWLAEWGTTPAGQAYRLTLLHDPNRRSYYFPIDANDSFRIEDVIPGRYMLRVWFWEASEPPAPARPVGPFVAAVEVPPMAEAYTDEPLDLGNLNLEMYETAHAGLAWRRTDRYVPPDPNSFFPDDPEAGKRLDKLFTAADKDDRPADEILSTVRRGLRRTTQHRTLILAWIGNRYVWNATHQHPDAIEIMYHAVPMERHYAIYFGLSVLKNKTPNVLRTLADICMQGQEVGRITWGVGSQREQLLAYITPHLQDSDPARREIAQVLVKHFRGELDFEQWQRDRHLEQVKAQFGSQLPQFKETLQTGASDARYQVLTTILHNQIGPLLDDSFLPALQAAGDDPDRRVRNEVARVAGGRWVWSRGKQDPNAIALMLKLSSDSSREVRYNAVYYGLSVVRDKSEPVIRRLVELALSDHENNLYGRIVWGFRSVSEAQPEPFVRILAEHLDHAKSNAHLAASIYSLYREVLGKEPPDDWGFAQVRPQYPDDLFIVPFSAREPFQPENADALWNEFTRALPGGITAERLPTWGRNARNIGEARVRGRTQAETVRNAIATHPRLRAGEIRPLPVPMQLYLEEMQGVAPWGTQAALPKLSADAGTSAPSPAPVQGPGPIQQRINAAAPGATIRLEPGLYKESLLINKPLTLEGAGWDKTVIVKERMAFQAPEDIERMMAERAAAAPNDAQRQEIMAQMKKEFTEKLSPLVLTVENAQDVVIRGIKFTSPGGHIKGGSIHIPLLKFDRSRVQLSDCAVLGGPGPGVHILNGSGAEIERTLVAAVWGTGIVVGPGPSESGVRIHDCDIRNCYYACMGIGKGASNTLVERCRIWGAAWHGIRYDDAAPQILGNLLYGHARVGIYASGQTAATVRNNLFYANEMAGMSCWFQTRDLIEGNTFVNNKEANLAIAGAAKPGVRRNIFYGSPVGISLGNINEDSSFAKSEGTVALQDNLFWHNDYEMQFRRDASTTEILAVGADTNTLRLDPGFTAPASKDFALRADSPARAKGIGAADLLPFEGSWPLQPEELAIIPKGDTRDWRRWRQPS